LLNLESTKNLISFHAVKDVFGRSKIGLFPWMGQLNPDNATNWLYLPANFIAGVENGSIVIASEYQHRYFEDEHGHHRRGHSDFGFFKRGVLIILMALGGFS